MTAQTWGTILIVIGIIYAILFLTKPTWLYNTAKVKAFVKLMGKKGFDILFLVLTVGFLVAGILLVR